MNKQTKIAISVLFILLMVSILVNIKFIFGNDKDILDKNLIKRNQEIIDSLKLVNKSLSDSIVYYDETFNKEQGVVDKENNNISTINDKIKLTDTTYDKEINNISNASMDSVLGTYRRILSKNKNFK